MNTHRTRLLLSAILLAAIAITGCQTAQTNGKDSRWDVRNALGMKSDKPEPQVPVRVVTTWTDTVLHQQGQKPQRGFGGRLNFFGRESDDPVRVEGQLVVYAFDESDREAHESHPTRRYVFPAEQFVRHEGQSKLGPSYSVWLPWDEVGGQQKNISLIVRFEPTAGPLLMGEQTKHLLPGTHLAANGESADPSLIQDTRVKTVQYSPLLESDVAKLPEQATALPKQMEVTAIPLPKR